ncbi:MAG: NADP-dependent malic enzyme [Candidatus Bipolaricaulis anaerobius]|nr:NADP-dependent malic enzyme [Candidatus Bipolaricaulis anaerobius]
MKENKPNVEELLAKAKEPGRKAPAWHAFYRGKVGLGVKCAITGYDDFAIWYTPGVAQPCREIAEAPEKVFEYTNKGNMVAVVSDGTRVLGLGDIGPHAALPVMEGKGLLFKYLGGVDAFPITLATKDADEIIQAVKWIAPAFGGINLEDFASPKCFYILDRLREETEIPVWHDDQQGTAAVTVAGVINALKLKGIPKHKARIAMIGAGAAGIATLRVLIAWGVNPGNVVMTDINGIVHRDRPDFDTLFRYTKDIVGRTNAENRRCAKVEDAIPTAMEGMDMVIGYSKPGPGTIKPEWVKRMAKDPIVFACANPIPEIWPWEAVEAGARIVGTGRSDFPNQINNSLGFPAIFRGTLDVFAKTITDEMAIAAAEAIAKNAEEKGLREDYIVPSMMDLDVFVNEAVAVGLKAIEQGVARRVLPKAELRKQAETMIRHARAEVEILQKQGHIPPPPKV